MMSDLQRGFDWRAGMKSRLTDFLMLEAILRAAAVLCAAAMIAGIVLAIVYWPLGTINVLLIAIVILL
jgi:hypothetical protein